MTGKRDRTPQERSHPQSTLQKQAAMVERLAPCILKSKFAPRSGDRTWHLLLYKFERY
ncbi:hypothetical protein H6F77_13940 [Microcoleus sp. FACHB-831]|uniref:hypothetical protein n=1 Tax=Microcoleus sp. FACHB-831 TaxID=2692827 RepID=UPI00168258C9|nr:hypothetical protein [Microcoleus sp. FACHB-831]MBD1922184.1 hypothetical protein [Microcoleus sp. FACHB-831]